MGIRDSLKRAGDLVVEELQKATGSPDPKSVDRYSTLSDKNTTVTRDGELDKHFPNRKNLQEYWELYQKVPIIRQPIRSFADEVVAPGYYVDTENEDLKEDIEEWLQSCAIVDGEVDRSFRMLLKKSIVQREVKGTSLVEKVEDDRNNLYGFKLMKPESVRAFTLPGQTVLIPPDYELDNIQDEQKKSFVSTLTKDQDIYHTEDDEAAAYVQIDDAIAGQSKGYYIPFTRDSVIKLTRDADVGDIFGTSRLLAIEDRLYALLKKLEDNDSAIESLASPFQLFLFGDEENPWKPSEIRNFMEQHSKSEFEPGMKQGVQGDISVETVSGEVAPIEDFLDFDLNWILSELPMPKYALGAFSSDVNQFISRAQSARLERQLASARHEIESEWTPVIKEKAEEMGYNPDDIEAFKLAEDPEDLNLVQEAKEDESETSDGLIGQDPIGGNIPDGNNSNEDNVGADGSDQSRPPASTEPDRVGDN